MKKADLFTFLFLLFHSFLFSQNNNDETVYEVEIIHADKLQYTTSDSGQSLRKLIGNVQLKQEHTLMFCDSAYMNQVENKLDAYGHIHINENDSIHAYSDYLEYEGDTRKAYLYDNVQLTDGDMTLYTNFLIYDMKNKIGSYTSFGSLEDDSTVLTSIKGHYFSQTKTTFFSDSVVITDPDYTLHSDTLSYNTKTQVAVFYGPTTIYNDSSTIDCISGWYDTEQKIASFGANTIVTNPPQTLYADSLYYEQSRGYGKALKHFIWNDSDMDAGMEGISAEYFEKSQTIIAYQRPILHVLLESDSMFIAAQQIHSRERPDTAIKEFKGYDDVRIYKEDMQGVCDSIFFSFLDSTFQMYYHPILWNEQNEMRGDTIYVLLKNENIHQARFFKHAFMTSQSQGKLFDQVKSTTITAYFNEGKLKRMLCNGEAESLYFGKNDDGAYVGGNKANAQKMWIYVDSSEVQKISFLSEPKAIFTPLSQMTKNDLYLQDFKWNAHLRPLSKASLLENKPE